MLNDSAMAFGLHLAREAIAGDHACGGPVCILPFDLHTHLHTSGPEAVSTWVDDIFSAHHAAVIVHGGLHWSLVLLWHVRSLLPGEGDGGGTPCMLHFDSLGLHHSPRIFNNLRRFLAHQWAKAHTAPLPGIASMPGVSMHRLTGVPRQSAGDSSSCGLWVLAYLQWWLAAAPCVVIAEAPARRPNAGRLLHVATAGPRPIGFLTPQWFPESNVVALRGALRQHLLHKLLPFLPAGSARRRAVQAMVDHHDARLDSAPPEQQPGAFYLPPFIYAEMEAALGRGAAHDQFRLKAWAAAADEAERNMHLAAVPAQLVQAVRAEVDALPPPAAAPAVKECAGVVDLSISSDDDE